MEKNLAIMNEYPADRFNLLIPVKTLQEISPMHKVVINQVQIDPDFKGGSKDVYEEKNKELALTKKALAKLMAAANIQVVDSCTVMPTKCKRCAEIAKSTKVAPICGTCPAADDVAYQVTLAVPEPSGTWRRVTCTKEIRMVDAKASMTDNQYKSFVPFRTEQCETKALNRALREALMISSTYKPEDLKKPFAVAYVVPNMSDPELKKAVAAQFANSVTNLFGKGQAPQQLMPGIEDNVTVIDPDEDLQNEQTEKGTVTVETVHDKKGDENPPWMTDDDKKRIFCEACAQLVEKSGNWTPEDIRDYSMKRFGKIMCRECQVDAKEGGKP